MAYLSLGFKVAGQLKKAWRAAPKIYAELCHSYNMYAGGPGYSTLASSDTGLGARSSLSSFFGIKAAHAAPAVSNIDLICHGGILKFSDGVPAGDGICDAPKSAP